ncbi:MAG: DNA primase [Sulfurifustis sp.]
MTGRIPKQFIDEVLLRADIVEVIDARVPLKKAGKDYKACCPFHDEKSPSFTVSPTKQFYHCFGCGAHGTAIGFLMEYEHMSFPEAVEELAGRLGLTLPKEVQTSATAGGATAQIFSVLEEAARVYRAQLRDAARAIAYLKGRGITGEIAAAFGIGYAPDEWDCLTRLFGKTPAERETLIQAGLAVRKDAGGCYDRFRDRIIFPIHDYRGRIVGFGGRIIDKGEPKYLNSPETPVFHKGRELYGLYRARESIRNTGRVLVVEGYMDVVALAQFGVDNAVATLGTATTHDHLERLFRFAPEVVFCFDGDRAGREAAWRATETALTVMHEGRQASFLFLPEGEDPDTLVRKEGTEAFRARLSRAVPLPDFFFQSLAKEVDLNRLDGRARLVELGRPLLSKVPAGVFREMMVDRLAEVTGAKRGDLAGALGTQSSTDGRAMQGFGSSPKSPPSVVRLAAALLIQHPELFGRIRDRRLFDDLDLPGMPVLRAVVDVLMSQPGLNTAAIVEQFRDSEHQQSVARLAVWRHSALAGDVSAQFDGVIARMGKIAMKTQTDRLLKKQQIYGLTPAEKAELTRLLAARMSPAAEKGY